MVRTVSMSFLLAGDASASECAEYVFELFTELFPEQKITRYGWSEPLRLKWKQSEPAISEIWPHGVLWKGRKGLMGMYDPSPVATSHDTIDFCLKTAHDGARQLEFVSRLNEKIPICFGVSQSIAEEELRDETRFLYEVKPLSSLATHVLKTGIPASLPWAVYFGAPYIDFFGEDRLRSVPTHLDDLGGLFAVRMTETVPMFHERFDQVELTRKKVVEHLGKDAFRWAGQGPKGQYIAPRVPELKREMGE